MQGTLENMHESPALKITLLNAGAYHAAKNRDFPPHNHTHWELVYYRSGAIGCVMSGQSHPGHVGLVWLTPPGVTHAERAFTAYSNYYIALELEHTEGWPVFMDDDKDRSLGRVCQQIVIEWNRKSPQRERMLALLAEQLTCLMDRAASEKILPHPALIVARAERVIEEKCGQSLTIREVAEAVSTSSSSLRSYFRTVRGYSPREYLQQARIERAVSFLRTSTLKLEVLAELCGYDSASHLTRCVKKATGQTPGQLRRR